MTDRCRHDHGDEHAVRPISVSLMADYGSYLWANSPELHGFRDEHGNLDAVRLGVERELARALADWHAEWEEANYGGGWSPGSPRAESHLGWELALRLQEELGPRIEVRYFHGIDHSGQGAGWNRPVLEREVEVDQGPEAAVLELRPGRKIATLRLQSPGAPPFDEGDWFDPQELGIDLHLSARLRNWNAAWTAVALTAGEPWPPGRREWLAEGHRLSDLLRDALATRGYVDVVVDEAR